MALVKRQYKKVVEPIRECDNMFAVHECPPSSVLPNLAPLLVGQGGFFVFKP